MPNDEPFPFPDEDPNDPRVKFYIGAWARMTPEQRKYFRDQWSKGDARYTRIGHWVTQLIEVAKTIKERGRTADWQTREFFWIRLYGVFEELPGALSRLTQDGQMDVPVVRAAKSAIEATQSLRALLDRGDAITLDWLRQRAAHLVQNGYTVRWNAADGSAKDRQTIKIVAETIEIKEINDIINAALLKYGGDDGLAVALVDRMEADLVTLYEAIRSME